MAAGLRLVPFAPAHLDLIEPYAEEAIVLAPGVDRHRLAVAYAEAGPAATFLAGGDAIAIAGLAMMWPGVAEGWALVGPGAARHPAAFRRAVGRAIETVRREKRLHRLQFAVLANHGRARRLARSLGFEEEGPLRRYGPGGEDFVRYARLYPTDGEWR